MITGMILFREALELLLEEVAVLDAETIRIEAAVGRILRQQVHADRDFPPFDRVMMDGYGLRRSDWDQGVRQFSITGRAPAGAVQVTLDEAAASCVEVMTGAPCPLGVDCILPVEEVAEIADGRVRFVETAESLVGEYLHRKGSDVAAGEVVLRPGVSLGAREIGVAASCGAAWLEVSRQPKISVVATGDELVAVDEVPLPHQIRQSNAHALSAALARGGFPVEKVGVIGDDESTALEAMATWLDSADWLILTGAVSKGGRDFAPSVLGQLGCRRLFHGIAQRPGKPAGCWIGTAGQMIVALPGNPVSALTGLHTLVMPALLKAAGAAALRQRLVVLDGAAAGLDRMTLHLPVTLRDDGRVAAAPTGNSGDFIGLLKSDGFVTLPPRQDSVDFPAAVSFTPWL